jgi:diguanylate cyclase (GGDEF)-like protein
MNISSSRVPSSRRFSGQKPEMVSTSAAQIVQLALREDVTLNELAHLATADPAFALRVLAFVNSPAMGLRRHVDDVNQATSLLGVRGMRTLALSLLVTGLGPSGEGAEILLANCLRRAFFARELALIKQVKDANPFFTTGLLLDSGLLASAKQDLELAAYIASAPADCRVVHERAAGFKPHPELGAEIARGYRLGDEMVNAIAQHHHLNLPAEELARIAWAAERCASIFEGGDIGQRRLTAQSAITAIGIHGNELETLVAKVPAMVTEFAAVLERTVGDQFDIANLESRAQERLVELNEHYEGLVRMLEELLRSKEALEQELRAANERLEHLASTDMLTTLSNRRAIDEALRRDIARADRDKTPLSVVLIDIDHFKVVNDTWGHSTGDAVLTFIGQLLNRSLRTSDVAGRWGGEEFLCILPNTDSTGATVVSERLRAELQKCAVSGPKGPVQVTASFGIAMVRGPGCRNEQEALIRRADSALYSAKAQGRNRVVVAP